MIESNIGDFLGFRFRTKTLMLELNQSLRLGTLHLDLSLTIELSYQSPAHRGRNGRAFLCKHVLPSEP